MMYLNNIGNFLSMDQVWEELPYGGKEGDFLFIGDIEYHWDKYDSSWKVSGGREEEALAAPVVKTLKKNVIPSPEPAIKVNEEAPKLNNLGSFDNLGQVWDKYPYGGKEGDYVTIYGESYAWNKYDLMWGDPANQPVVLTTNVCGSKAGEEKLFAVQEKEAVPSNKGEFASMEDVWQSFPNGGKEGDYVVIKGQEYPWNKFTQTWGSPGLNVATAPYPVSHLDGKLEVENDVSVGNNVDIEGWARVRRNIHALGDVMIDGVLDAPVLGSDTAVRGNLQVYRNTSLSGDLTVGQNITAEGNVVVKGVLKAKSVSQPNKGLFSSEERLKEAWPNPNVGDWAMVGERAPGVIWVCNEEGVWTCTGKIGGMDSVIMDDYLHKYIDSEALAIVDFKNGFKVNGNLLNTLLLEHSKGPISDLSFMTARRVMKEIETNLKEQDERYLRKDKEDETKFLIRFFAGAEFGLNKDGNVASVIEKNGAARFEEVSSRRFISGFPNGSGYMIAPYVRKNAAGVDEVKYRLEIDDAVFRGSLKVFEFIRSQLRGENDNVIFAGMMKVDHIDIPNRTIYFDTQEGEWYNPFRTGDILMAQRVWGRPSEDNGYRLVTQYELRVVEAAVGDESAGKDRLDYIRYENFVGDESDVQEGDYVCRVDNDVDETRKGIIKVTTIDEFGAPYIDVVYGMKTNPENCTKLRLGRLEGLVTTEWGRLEGYGLMCENVYLKGCFKLATGEDVKTKFEITEGHIEAEIKSRKESENGIRTDMTTSLSIQDGKISSAVEKVNTFEGQVETFGTRIDQTESSISSQAVAITQNGTKISLLEQTVDGFSSTVTSVQGDAEKAKEIANAAQQLADSASNFATTAYGLADRAWDKADAAEAQAATAISQSESAVAILAGNFDQDGNVLSSSTLVVKADLAELQTSMKNEFGDDITARLATYVKFNPVTGALESNIQLTANNIKLEGYTTINDSFEILADGTARIGAFEVVDGGLSSHFYGKNGAFIDITSNDAYGGMPTSSFLVNKGTGYICNISGSLGSGALLVSSLGDHTALKVTNTSPKGTALSVDGKSSFNGDTIFGGAINFSTVPSGYGTSGLTTKWRVQCVINDNTRKDAYFYFVNGVVTKITWI